MNYPRRLVKFLLYVVVIIAIFIYVIPAVSGKGTTDIAGKLKDPELRFFWIFFMVYTLVFPLIGYTKIQRHLNGTFLQNQDAFAKAFEMLDYIKTEESQDQIVYRKKSKFIRFMQMYEDGIVVKPGDNPVIISGMRKTVKRIDRMLDQLLIKESGQN